MRPYFHESQTSVSAVLAGVCHTTRVRDRVNLGFKGCVRIGARHWVRENPLLGRRALSAYLERLENSDS